MINCNSISTTYFFGICEKLEMGHFLFSVVGLFWGCAAAVRFMLLRDRRKISFFFGAGVCGFVSFSQPAFFPKTKLLEKDALATPRKLIGWP